MLRQAEAFTSWAQLDIMDGAFVPSRSITAADIARAKPQFQWEAHLMVQDPSGYFDSFRQAGAQKIVFHYEAASNIEETVRRARAHNLRVGLAANPETPVSTILPLLGLVDGVLFLSVNPGFYGAPFIPAVLDKVKELRRFSPLMEIGIDGGIKESNVGLAAKAGADFICVGSAIFRHPNPGESFLHLQSLADEAAE